MKSILFLLLCSAVAGGALRAASPAGVAVWKSSDLKEAEKLPAKGKSAAKPLGNFGNHMASVSHRESSGEAEVHEHVADVFVVQTGEATLVVGGTIPGSKKTAEGELRGPSIADGEKHALRAGDAVHIPANVPHQFLLEPGKQITYFVLKVNSAK